MDDNEITALVGWPTEPEMAKFRKVVAAAEAAERERCAKLVEQVADDCDEWRPLDGSRGVALRAAAVRIRGA